MFDFTEKVQAREKELKSKEHALGKSLYQPFTDSNSGPRKVMAGTQIEHALQLYNPEVAITMTGYEHRYGDESSAIIQADDDYEVVGKVSKFSDSPNHHYYLLMRNINTNELKVFERKIYHYTGETYGYLYNTELYDSLDIGYEIPKGEVLRRSKSTDENLNRMDGVNLTTVYTVCEITKEDGVQLSKSGRDKLASPLFKRVTINFNDNDTFLNIMGDDNIYKSFPFIGEKVKNGILCSIRRDQSDTALFTQSVKTLQRPLMSDDKYTIAGGTVIDIEINCNNPDILADKHSNCQLLYYYNDRIRFLNEFINTVNDVKNKYNIEKMSYELEVLYVDFKRELQGVQFIDNGKVYSGSYIQFTVLDKNYPEVGDKITNRYGGKGVIAKIVDDEMMPRLPDTGEIMDCIMNGCTCVNRTNAGQAHELSLTHINSFLISFFRTGTLTTAEIMQTIIVFLSYCSVKEAIFYADYFNNLDDEDKDLFVQGILDDGYIQMSIKPMSESMTQDKIAQIYKEFPWVHQRALLVPQIGSRGDIRYIYSRRPVVIGRMYIYRLKQYAEEKFSVTNLSSTNLRGENSRNNKASKNYKALHPATPVQFGYMEADEFGHMGFETVIETFMIHSLSPQARQLAESLYIDDPYNIDIRLDGSSKNRSAEQVMTYLKAIGYKLLFLKKKKIKKVPFTRRPFTIQSPPNVAIKKISIKETGFDIDQWIKFSREQYEKKMKHPFTIAPYMVDDEK